MLRAENAPDTPRPLYIYDAGGLEMMSAEDQGKLVEVSGFAGMVFEVESDADLVNLPRQLATGRPPYTTKTMAVTVRFDFVDFAKEMATSQKVIRAIADQGIDLWVIIGNKNKAATIADAENMLVQLVDYASEHGVLTAIYPHSYCLINSAEEALPLVEKLNLPDLSMVIHLCHEMRAGNTERLREVFQAVAPHVSAMTLSGCDDTIDWTSRKTMTHDTIKPLDLGNFDWAEYVADAERAGIHVPITFINFKIPDAPSDYLPRSIAVWNQRINGQP